MASAALQVPSHSRAHLCAAPLCVPPRTLIHPHTHAPSPPLQAVEKANDLFDKYAAAGSSGQGAAAGASSSSGNGSSEARVTMKDLQALMREASEAFPHLKEHSIFLDG